LQGRRADERRDEQGKPGVAEEVSVLVRERTDDLGHDRGGASDESEDER